MDLKQLTEKALRGAFRMYAQDLEALPEAAFTHHFGGKSRTVADITYEVNLVNDHIGLTLREEDLFDWPEGWITAPEGLRAKADVIKAFEISSAKILDTLDGFTLDDLDRPVQTEHGETTVLERFRFMAWHTSYHSGQLNFIQSLLGDDGWHWS